MSRSVKIRKNVVTELLREERGIVAVIFAILLPLFLGLAALAIDMSYAYKVRNTTQVTSSAAALAGVSVLYDADGNDNPNDDDVPNNASEDYRREAIEYAYRNMSEAVHGNVVSALCGSFDPVTDAAGVDDLECDDIKAGHWDGATFHAWDGASYVPATMEIDALQVQTHRAAGGGNDNPLQLFFAGALGLSETDINTTAVATTGGGDISNGCIIALNNEDGEDQTLYINGTASITTIGCDIRVDQCCTDPSSCKQGALRANGTPLVEIIAETCGVDETCAGPGIIDVCGTILEQGQASLEATINCTGDDASNYYTDAMCGEPSYDNYDPLTEFADDKSYDWALLAGGTCDFVNFEITKLDDPGYEYYSPGDVTTVTEPVLDPDTGLPVLDPDTGEM
ncbi:MAG: pilus assembly protein, partial [Planctomycetota bacterium]|nr:pilus assembly protein [Planctomycetota bacterium]